MKSHAELKERWEGVLQNIIEGIPVTSKLYDTAEKNNGRYNFRLYGDYRGLAVLDYLLNHNVVNFRENLSKAVFLW